MVSPADVPPAFVATLDTRVRDVVVRLVRAVDDPLERRIVAPMIVGELVFRLLRSDAAAIRSAVPRGPDGDPRPGERVAVLGFGGLGHLAVQLSKAVGLETIALTGQADKNAELRALGADEVLVTGDDPGSVVRDAGGADVILSTTNSARQISAAVKGLRPGGRLINMGVADGPISIDPMTLMMGQRQVRGSSQDDANAALDRLAAGKVRYRAVLQRATR